MCFLVTNEHTNVYKAITARKYKTTSKKTNTQSGTNIRFINTHPHETFRLRLPTIKVKYLPLYR